MAEESLDRIRDWERRTGSFIRIGNQGNSNSSSDNSGVPF